MNAKQLAIQAMAESIEAYEAKIPEMRSGWLAGCASSPPHYLTIITQRDTI